ncbi:MAG: TlpA disulfide reductase family protein [Spirochaetota bacterium]
MKKIIFYFLPLVLILLACTKGAGTASGASAPTSTQTAASDATQAESRVRSVKNLSLPDARDLQTELKQLGFHVFEEKIPIVDFTLEALSGKKISLSSLKGKVVLLNFWATWCPPCREEMPSMELLYKKLHKEGLEIVAVDLQEEKKQVQKFAADNGLTFQILLDTTGRVGASYGARSIPTSYIIDKNGIVLAGVVGGRDWHTPELLSMFRELLKR